MNNRKFQEVCKSVIMSIYPKFEQNQYRKPREEMIDFQFNYKQQQKLIHN